MIYIDASELRPQSKLASLIPDGADYIKVPDLEYKTGADIMVSLPGLPKPVSNLLLKRHIQSGAKLLQLKFGHDLTASIMDGRFKDAQSKMKIIGAAPWQCCLAFIGIVHQGDNGEALINGQPIYGGKNIKFIHILKQISIWADRGGSFYQIPNNNLIWQWVEMQSELLQHYKEVPQKQVWPAGPVLLEKEIDSELDTKEYLGQIKQQAQGLDRVIDIRVMFATLPGIGPTKSQLMYDNGVQTVNDLIGFAYEGIPIKGIGNKTLEKIRDYLGLETE